VRRGVAGIVGMKLEEPGLGGVRLGLEGLHSIQVHHTDHISDKIYLSN